MRCATIGWLFCCAVVLSVRSSDVSAGTVIFFSDPSGLSAEAEFTMLNPTTLEVRLRNTSTGVPFGFDEADQLLTGISWDFGEVGQNVPYGKCRIKVGRCA